MAQGPTTEEVYPEFFPDIRKWRLRGRSASTLQELQLKFPGLRFAGYCPMSGDMKVLVPRAVIPAPRAAPQAQKVAVKKLEPRTRRRPASVRSWSEEEDRRLMEMYEREHRVFSDICKELGRTRNACIGRYHRLVGKRRDLAMVVSG